MVVLGQGGEVGWGYAVEEEVDLVGMTEKVMFDRDKGVGQVRELVVSLLTQTGFFAYSDSESHSYILIGFTFPNHRLHLLAMSGNEKWCVVTGGQGFAARHLVQMLIRYDVFRVRIADLEATVDLEPYEENGILAEALSSGRAQYVAINLRSKSQVLQAFQGVEVVFHMAAPNSSINNYQLHRNPMSRHNTSTFSSCFRPFHLHMQHLLGNYGSKKLSPSIFWEGA